MILPVRWYLILIAENKLPITAHQTNSLRQTQISLKITQVSACKTFPLHYISCWLIVSDSILPPYKYVNQSDYEFETLGEESFPVHGPFDLWLNQRHSKYFDHNISKDQFLIFLWTLQGWGWILTKKKCFPQSDYRAPKPPYPSLFFRVMWWGVLSLNHEF